MLAPLLFAGSKDCELSQERLFAVQAVHFISTSCSTGKMDSLLQTLVLVCREEHHQSNCKFKMTATMEAMSDYQLFVPSGQQTLEYWLSRISGS